jgi:hypothetical protein
MDHFDRLKKGVDNRPGPRYRWPMDDHERRDLQA